MRQQADTRAWLALARRNSQRASSLEARERRLKNDLAGREEARRKLLSRLRHDLAGPLNTLSGFLELLAEERAGELNTVQRSYLEHMRQAAGRALGLIDSVAGRVPENPDEAPAR